MKIGIDIDDVLVEFAKGYLNKYEEKYEKKVNFEDIFSFDLWKPLGISKQEAIDLADSYYDSLEFDNIGVLEGAKSALREISKNYEIFLITSRPIKLKEKTNNFINQHFSGIPLRIIFSNDFFSQGMKSKAQICEEEGIKLIIEDNKNYSALCAKKGIKVFLFDKPWNKNFKRKNIERVYNWSEILERLKNEIEVVEK